MSAIEERIHGWKSIAAEIGVSVTKARSLADPYIKIHLPVFHDWIGPYVTKTDLEWWKGRYKASHGFHAELKKQSRANERSEKPAR